MQKQHSADQRHSYPSSQVPRSTSLLSKQYLIDAGKITRVTNFMGAIRFRFDDENGRFDECLFFLNSYCLKRIRTLCQVFTVGDWVGFVAVKMDGGHWTALDVRPRAGIMSGYGQLRKTVHMDGFSAFDAIIRPQFRAPFGGGDIAICKRTFRKSGQKTFEHLVDGEWLRFLAMEKPEQAPKGVCSAVAIEAEIPLLIGLVVKRLKEYIQIWCTEVGLTTSEVDPDFPSKVGDWVRFRLAAQTASDGQWRAIDITTTTAPPEVSVKVGRHIRVTAVVVTGVLSNRFGTVWSDKLGRMTIWRWCLKNVAIRPFERLVVRAFYNSNDERKYNTQGDAWTVYELKIAPTMPKVPAFAPSPCIIYNAQAVVEEVCMTPRKWYATSTLPPCFWRLRSERFGRIIAWPVDVLPIVTDEGRIISAHIKPGDRVKVALVPVSLSDVDEYRAFVVEKYFPPGFVANISDDLNQYYGNSDIWNF